MTLLKRILKDNVFIDFEAGIEYGSDQAYKNQPARFATVTFQLRPTSLLDGLAERMRKEKGYRPLNPKDEYSYWDADNNAWYDYSIGLNDFDPLKIDTCIVAVVCNSSALDEGDPYFIDLNPEEQKVMLEHLDRQCRSHIGKGCMELLGEARKRMEVDMA